MPKSLFITGDRQLDRKLARLRKTTQSKIVYAGLRKGGPIVSRAIKNALPSRYKSARAAVGWRFESRRQNPLGVATVKAGAAVGKRNTKSFQRKQAKAADRATSNRPGVGISARNIHWLLLGTGERRQTGSGRRTGRMPGLPQLVPQAFAATQGTVKAAMLQRISEGIRREAAKR